MDRLGKWMGLIALAVGISACGAPGGPETGSLEQAGVVGQFCGGIAGIACPDGYTCVDDPSDKCDPRNGGADCGGVCRKARKPKKDACNDPARTYVSRDPAQCAVIRYLCADGQAAFSDECGCGCVAAPAIPCGPNTCGDGEYCCNESCGICAPIGGVCIQIACAN